MYMYEVHNPNIFGRISHTTGDTEHPPLQPHHRRAGDDAEEVSRRHVERTRLHLTCHLSIDYTCTLFQFV